MADRYTSGGPATPFLSEALADASKDAGSERRLGRMALESPFLNERAFAKDFESSTYNFERPADPEAFGTERLAESEAPTFEYDQPADAVALGQAIQGGERDPNQLTNRLFFARHPELPQGPLQPDLPKFKELSAEWARILEKEVWPAIQAASENRDLVVAGAEVASHDRFFWGRNGQRLKQLVADAAREVDLNPGLLGTIMMAETRRPRSYLSSAKVRSYHIGADDFYEGRAAIKARVPAYARVRWDKNQVPESHLNDARKPRLIKTILFDSGPAAVLATAVYVKFREVRLRELAAAAKGDFDSLPVETRFALTRMAMAAGTEGARPWLEQALAGQDILVRKPIKVVAYGTQRNATVRTAQALHLSEWIFGIQPVPAGPPGPAPQPEPEDASPVQEEWAGEAAADTEFEGSYTGWGAAGTQEAMFEALFADLEAGEAPSADESPDDESDEFEASEGEDSEDSEDGEVEVFDAFEADPSAAEAALEQHVVFERDAAAFQRGKPMNSPSSDAPFSTEQFGGSLLEADAPYLGGGYSSGDGRDDPRQRIAELAAQSPFVQELEANESWMRRLPARAAQHVFKTLQRVRSRVQAACPVFLPANPSDDYERHVAAATTGRMTPFINGRSWGGAKPREDQVEAFNSMQAAVEGLNSGNSLLLAAWHFDPSVPLTNTNLSGVNGVGNRTWGELLQRKARDGVRIRIIMTDFDPIAHGIHGLLHGQFLPALNQLIAGLAPSVRDNLKYIVSQHPAIHAGTLEKVVIGRKLRVPFTVHSGTHHQKFMVLKTGEASTAFCGGLDIAYMRTPFYWGRLDKSDYRWLWHDIHSRLEGLITHDLEREFVQRWNREKGQSMVSSQAGWEPFETLVLAPPTKADEAADRNTQQLQMLRTVSVRGTPIHTTRRDDIWQGYLRLIGCATRFLYMENQYFREPRMADAIVKQAKAQTGLLVIIVVPSETDDLPDMIKKHGDSLQHEFFARLTKGVPASRLRVYTMFHRIIHSKFIMADDRALCLGSANANPRGFFLDTELNLMLDDPQAVAAFRHRLWAHNLGIAPTTVARWSPSAFIARWDALAAANQRSPKKMIGEAVIPFDALKEKGERQEIIDDVETESAEFGGSNRERRPH